MLFKIYKFDILHVQHFLFQSFDVVDIAKKYNTYSIISLHDMYMLCPSINLVFKDKYCLINENRDCKKCLHDRYGLNNNITNNWKKTSYRVLQKFDKIIVPSQNTKDMYLKQYPGLDIDVIEHGVNLIKHIPKREVTKKDNKFKDIAFVGVMVPHKGSKILKDLIKNKEGNIRIHLFGKAFEKSLMKNKSNYIYHGEYKREKLPELLVKNNIKLVCIFSTVPETYSYTLTETLMAKTPVVSFDIGAVPERIKKDDLGWVLPLDSSIKQIYTKIEEILSNKEEYEIKKQNCKNYKIKTIEEMQDEYINLYENANIENHKIEAVKTFDIIKLQKENSQYEYQIYRSKYDHIINKYERLRSTKIWKIAKKIKAKLRGK